MNQLRNKVMLIGNIGMDPEIKEINGGKKLARMTLATHERYKTRSGEKVEDTQWHNLVIWGKLAEIAEKYCAKGNEIAVEGKITNRSWEDREGVRRYTTEIVVNDLLLLGRKNP
jgi:single-strand DNA-binding protein